MGSRKHIMAERLKAEKKQKAIAVLNDCPTSPLKMRIVADTIRGVEINRALGMLQIGEVASFSDCELGAEERGTASRRQ